MRSLIFRHQSFEVISGLSLGLVLSLCPNAWAQATSPSSGNESQQGAPPASSNQGGPANAPAVANNPSSAETTTSPKQEAGKTANDKPDDERDDHHSEQGVRRADVLALTVSGGVSLGSHEGGMIHLLTEALRRSPGSTRLKVVTGASAGSANAIIAGTEACHSKIELPEDSLGYRAWVKTGLDDLFDPQRVTSHSLLVRDGLRAGYNVVKDSWQKGLSPDCDFAFGVAVTREQGYNVDLAPGLVVPRQAERFMIRVQGRGVTKAPAFSNYLDPAQSFERPLLPLTEGRDKEGKADTAAIWQLISASAAFPVAFAPQPIEHCTTARRNGSYLENSQESPRCEVATRVDNFVDGGMFDNNPLGTAYDIATHGLYDTGSDVVFRTVPTGGSEKKPDIVFGYVDPDLRNYTVYEPEQRRDNNKRDPMLNILTRLGGQALSSARGRELATFAERHPDALKQLWTLEASYPPMSELMAAFFGFFEEDFRDFDFHLGSYDTYRDLRDHSGARLGVEPFLDGMAHLLAGPVDKLPPRYTKLGCILAHTEPDRHGGLAPLCDGESMRNFRVLLQVTIDRLWSNCRRLTENETSGKTHLQCKRARGGIAAPVVDSSFKVKRWRYKRSSEDEFDYVMRLLADYQFHFKDLGLKPEESKMGRLAVRRELAAMVQAISNAQPGFTARTLVLTAGRMMVNRIEYEPPPRRWYAMVGNSIAVGYLHQLGRSNIFLNPEVRQHSFRTLITDRPNEFSGALSFGVEWSVPPLSGSIMQTALGVRGGYKFALEDKIGFDACDEVTAGEDSRGCSQPVIHVPISLTILERLRFSLIPVFYPMPQSWGHKVFDLEVGFGGEFF